MEPAQAVKQEGGDASQDDMLPVIPGIDWRCAGLRDMWLGWPTTWPGREKYFSFKGMLNLYPAKVVRIRDAGGAPENDWFCLRMRPDWETANPGMAGRMWELWKDEDVYRVLADVDWLDAPVEESVA